MENIKKTQQMSGPGRVGDDLLPEPVETLQELADLEEEIKDVQCRNKLVSNS